MLIWRSIDLLKFAQTLVAIVNIACGIPGIHVVVSVTPR
jgi:hypothetical protein